MSEILFILPVGRFDDHIYTKTRQILERNNHQVKVASTVKKGIFGLNNTRVMVDFTLEEVKTEDFAAIVLGGGIGAQEYFQSEILKQILTKANSEGKILGAIANSPMILARAGLLKGKRATVFYFESKQFKELGADYTAEAVTTDGNLITAKAPDVADKFALALVKCLSKLA